VGTLIGEPAKFVRLFYPRSDRWSACFYLHGIEIEALSPIGAATTSLLQLNEPSRQRERATLQAVGRFPTIEALARMKE